jgi:hypothetical protein
MTITGFGVGAAFAVNPIQIVDGVPPAETGSAISFYQLVRSVGYSLASALSATALAANISRSQRLPADATYSTASTVDLAVLGCTLIVAILLAVRSSPSLIDVR